MWPQEETEIIGDAEEVERCAAGSGLWGKYQVLAAFMDIKAQRIRQMNGYEVHKTSFAKKTKNFKSEGTAAKVKRKLPKSSSMKLNKTVKITLKELELELSQSKSK